ncbi:MAG: hypothetical protein EA409_09770 [Saprospirales bacterium]|nr:MAG: hypothetical protein EA409_09770 [Saprospirales bacterium]
MKINKNNYEEFAIDYLDGNLPKSIKLAFDAFLEKNPEIAEEFEGLNSAVLTPEVHGIPIAFQKKKYLYKKTPIVALLNHPLQIKLWQVAAALLLLLTTVWIGIEYYLTSDTSGIQAESMEYTDGNQMLVSSGDHSDKVSEATVTDLKKTLAESTEIDAIDNRLLTEKKDQRKYQEEKKLTDQVIDLEEAAPKIAAAKFKEAIEEVEMEPIVSIELDMEFEEWLPSRVHSDRINQSPTSISSLPSRNIGSTFTGSCSKSIDHGRIPKAIRFQKPEEEKPGTLFARLAERVVPASFADWLDPTIIQIDTEKIPPALLPEVVKQNSL